MSRVANRTSGSSSTSRTVRVMSRPFRGCKEGQAEGEARSPTGLALDPDPAPEQFDVPAHDAEAEASAPLSRDHGALVEALEDASLLPDRDPDSLVRDGNRRLAVAGCRDHADCRSLPRELRGVRQQVSEDPLETALIGRDLEIVHDFERDMPFGEGALRKLDAVGHGVANP